jgi:hypothetical protein
MNEERRQKQESSKHRQEGRSHVPTMVSRPICDGPTDRLLKQPRELLQDAGWQGSGLAWRSTGPALSTTLPHMCAMRIRQYKRCGVLATFIDTPRWHPAALPSYESTMRQAVVCTTHALVLLQPSSFGKPR